MSQNLQSILDAARSLPPDELRQLVEHLLAEVGTNMELQPDDNLGREILEAERQITRGEVVSWPEVKLRHRL
jgi:hypothetical protein